MRLQALTGSRQVAQRQHVMDTKIINLITPDGADYY